MKLNFSTSSLFLTSLLFLFFLTQGFAQSSWKSSDYRKENYRKVVVLAKTSNPGAKRLLEDQTVAELQADGIQAIPAYSNITERDLASENALIAKADQLEADALLVYNFNPLTSEYKNGPSVNANLGIPVKVGIFRGFLGTNVPIAGGPKQVQKFSGSVSFYNRQSSDMQWNLGIGGKIGSDATKQARSVAKKAVKAAVRDGIF
ncbi:MAG: hypothetical protein ACJLTB_04255 [Algoriphagus aquaeductus]|uniref:hypothetical protein n=1 Tax=Algoriphagus aquaeductus TaxID=475299 RepID=UPI0038796642